MTKVHVAEIVHFTEDAARQLRGPEATQWRERLEGRYDECRAALDWLVASGRTEEALRVVLALVDFWQYTDRISDGREWLDRVLLARAVEDALTARAVFEAGLFAFWQGDDCSARALHLRCLELARRLDLSDSAALALTGLARIELRTDVHRARALSLEALEAAETNESRGRSSALHVLGVAAQMSGDYPQARDWMSQRLELAEKVGDLRLVAAEAGNLSVVELRLGHLGRARELADTSLRLAIQCGDAWMTPYCFNAQAAIAVETREYERAVTLLSAADKLLTEQGAEWPPDERPIFEQSRARAVEALSRDAFEQAWSTGRRQSTADAVSYALQFP